MGQKKSAPGRFQDMKAASTPAYMAWPNTMHHEDDCIDDYEAEHLGQLVLASDRRCRRPMFRGSSFGGDEN